MGSAINRRVASGQDRLGDYLSLNQPAMVRPNGDFHDFFLYWEKSI
jgi:hypothetical protein